MLGQLEIGDRLRTAREQCDISQEEAANALVLSPADLSKLESGDRAASTLEITKLAELYHYPATFFLSADKELSGDDSLVVLHKELSQLKSQPEVRDALWRLFDLYGEITVLRGMLDRSVQATLPNYSALTEGRFGHTSEEAEFAAEKERDRLALGNQPVRDVAEIIGNQGIWTASIDFPDDLSGLFVNQDFGLAILVNRNHSLGCRRFSYLHGFAHALFDRSGKAAMMTRKQDSFSDGREVRANQFAAAFLMPPEGVAEKLDEIGKGFRIPPKQMGSDLADNVHSEPKGGSWLGAQAVTREDAATVAHHFGVSYKVSVLRLHNLEFIDSRTRDTLVQQHANAKELVDLFNRSECSQDFTSSEISEHELCSQLKDLAIGAFRQEEISRGRLAEIGKKLKISRDALLELAQAPHFA